MLLKQYYLGCLAHASYLIADEATGTAVVVDPHRDIDQYLHDTTSHGWHIDYVFLTHFHADFLAGISNSGTALVPPFVWEPRPRLILPSRRLHTGETLTFGDVRLRVLETPGHTPEAISILVYDLQQDPEHPHAVLTGDTLFIGDVGRPDLMASVGISQTTLAGMLYDSLHQHADPAG